LNHVSILAFTGNLGCGFLVSSSLCQAAVRRGNPVLPHPCVFTAPPAVTDNFKAVWYQNNLLCSWLTTIATPRGRHRCMLLWRVLCFWQQSWAWRTLANKGTARAGKSGINTNRQNAFCFSPTHSATQCQKCWLLLQLKSHIHRQEKIGSLLTRWNEEEKKKKYLKRSLP